MTITKTTMKNWKWKVISLLVLTLLSLNLLVLPKAASAHPLGNFTVNHYSRLEVSAAGIKLYYVVDMAEIPTFQEKDKIDTNHDGQISDFERLTYLDQQIKQLQPNLKLLVDGAPTQMKLIQQDLTFLPGQGGLETMRLTASFVTPSLANNAASLTYQDDNYSDRVGWKEVVVRNATGVAIKQSNVSNIDQSNELRNYPQDMLTSPLAVTSAQVSIKLDPSIVVKDTSTTATPAANAPAVQNRAQDPFADLVNSGDLTLGVILFSLVFSFIWGALHAFSPGHGKTIVAAYLVGSRATARHALFLGLTVTVTHTLGVFALGLITLFASQFIVPDKLYPWLGLLSGLIVVWMGINMLRSRLSPQLAGILARNNKSIKQRPQILAYVGQTQGTTQVSPSSATLSAPIPAHNYSDGNVPDHTHQVEDDNSRLYDFSQDTPGSSEDGYVLHTHPDGTAHSHNNGVIHSHLPPGANGTPMTRRQLLSFGISAGLLPCPSALVVMLSTIALGRVLFGIVLVIIFSFGLAATLSAMGLLFVYARGFMTRLNIKPAGRLLKYAPIASAAIITVLGVVISFGALMQTGLFSK